MSRTIENIDCYQMMRGKSDCTLKISLMVLIFGIKYRKNFFCNLWCVTGIKKCVISRENPGKGREHERGRIRTNALLQRLYQRWNYRCGVESHQLFSNGLSHRNWIYFWSEINGAVSAVCSHQECQLQDCWNCWNRSDLLHLIVDSSIIDVHSHVTKSTLKFICKFPFVLE